MINRRPFNHEPICRNEMNRSKGQNLTAKIHPITKITMDLPHYRCKKSYSNASRQLAYKHTHHQTKPIKSNAPIFSIEFFASISCVDHTLSESAAGSLGGSSRPNRYGNWISISWTNDGKTITRAAGFLHKNNKFFWSAFGLEQFFIFHPAIQHELVFWLLGYFLDFGLFLSRF